MANKFLPALKTMQHTLHNMMAANVNHVLCTNVFRIHLSCHDDAVAALKSEMNQVSHRHRFAKKPNCLNSAFLAMWSLIQALEVVTA